MALGRTLGWSVPTDVEIFAVEGAVFDQFRRGLTPPVSRGLDEVVQVVASRVDSESFLKRHEELEVTHAGGR